MAVITLTTFIEAPADRCFLLSLSVDLHTGSTAQTGEKAIAGVTHGIMKLYDTVTWEARHFGVVQRLTSKITEYERPLFFVDEMEKGIFKKLHHLHSYKEENGGTTMTDVFEFEAPFGGLGRLAGRLFLKAYLENFLVKRNAFIKQVAESGDWKKYLEGHG
ncbi:MAG: SRPBCC family protein [Bacteroidia bacterium]